MHFAGRVFFVPQSRESREPSFAAAVFWALLLFVATRLAVIELLSLRHYHLLASDARNYLDIADYIRTHGRLPQGDDAGLRQFAGLALLIAAATTLTHDTVIAAYAVTWTAAMASVVLFHALGRNFRMTLLYVVFVPAWVSSSTLVASEGVTFLLMLVLFWAFERVRDFAPRVALLVVAGYALLVRNPAALFMVPFVVAWWWRNERAAYGLPRLAAYLAAIGFFAAAGLAFNRVTLGEWLPQLRGQIAYFSAMNTQGFPPGLFAWPGEALAHGFFVPSIAPAKKLSVLASLVLAVAVPLILVATRRTRMDPLAVPFAAGAVCHLAFHLCIGGMFGFSSFDRYVSHINPVIVRTLAQGRQLRWVWMAVAAVAGVAFAGFTGHSEATISILPALKSG